MRAKDALGRWGEQVAADHLVAAGLTIVDRNWRCPDGEIDIVALDGSALVVCEVKTRTSTRFGTPLAAVTATKAARLGRLGWAWRRAHDAHPSEVRIDVVSVLKLVDRVEVEHHRGVI